ncbi:MAG: Hpt domain-containing protein, partial [Clostridiales bacterium]|nr:Hpt domain-containing protein [Clostridiales bacterium]
MADFDRESMSEMFTFEMGQLIEQLEQHIIQSESGYTMGQINEIFRIMHTIKGSAAMMLYDSISNTAHAMEDLFFYLREESPQNVDYPLLTDMILAGMDFIKEELTKVENKLAVDGDGTSIIADIKAYLEKLRGGTDTKSAEITLLTSAPVKSSDVTAKSVEDTPKLNSYYISVKFTPDAEMENVRAYALVSHLRDIFEEVTFEPDDLMDEAALFVIQHEGLKINIKTDSSRDELSSIFEHTAFLREINIADTPEQLVKTELVEEFLEELDEKPDEKLAELSKTPTESAYTKVSTESADSKPQTAIKIDDTGTKKTQTIKTSAPAVISVPVSKLDQLLNLMGELVISEAMVTQNPELENLELDSFFKETRQLRKIIKDLQEIVMSMRMVPLSTTFFKMHRIVRDMCRQLGKDVQLEVIGEETEVDKNIIEHISDPLMHIIRNSVDHGIETPENRISAGKPEKGTVTLEAKNSGGDVLIIIKDDGVGLDRDRILKKAKSNGLLKKPEGEYSDKEIQQFIFLPGFSTNEQVTSF